MMEENYKKRAMRFWGKCPAGLTHAPHLKPGTKEFFEEALKKRFSYETEWLLEIMKFSTFKNRRVIEVGCGNGFDAFQFMKNGAQYFGCDIAFENCSRTKIHLSHYNLNPFTIQADAEHLPFKTGCFDHYFSFGVLHHIPNFKNCLLETKRVLRNGGDGTIIVYNKNSIFYWLKIFLRDYILGGEFRKKTMEERLREIESGLPDEKPYVKVYTKRELKRIFREVGLKITWIKVRKLVIEDLPFFRGSNKIYRLIPYKVYRYLSYIFGWYIIVRFKKEV